MNKATENIKQQIKEDNTFKSKEFIQLISSRKSKIYRIQLEAGCRFSTKDGFIEHNDIIGNHEGVVIDNSKGVKFLALRTILEDFILSMPRGANIMYPKDSAQVITMGDIFPGAKVVEAGVGSGALTISLLRAVGDKGKVYSFEAREEFAKIAKKNIDNFFTKTHPGWTLVVKNFLDDLSKKYIQDNSIDRVILDMLAPWECVDNSLRILKPGGVFIIYVTTTTQLSRIVEQLNKTFCFTEPCVTESMLRGWHIDGLAVRPNHRMVGHTGFLVIARKLFKPLSSNFFHKKKKFKIENS